MPIALPLAIVGSAAVGAVATSSAAKKNAKAAQYAADQNAQTIKDTQAQNNALYQPYVERGNKAGDALNSFLGLSGTPAQDNAFKAYRDSTGYQFQLQSGMDAINSNKATAGLLKSGSTLKAAQKYGQNVASTYTGNYINALQNQQGVGLNAAGGNAASNSNAAGMNVNNNNNLANSQIQSNTASANALTNLLGNAVSAYGYAKGQSSYGSSDAFRVKQQADDGGYTPAPSLSRYSTPGIVPYS